MSGFFAQGGYAAFIWPAYGISFVAIACAIWLTFAAHHGAKARLALLEKRGP